MRYIKVDKNFKISVTLVVQDVYKKH